MRKMHIIPKDLDLCMIHAYETVLGPASLSDYVSE